MCLMCSCVSSPNTGAGRVVGEQTEQLWAEFKRILHLTRYMSAPNHQATLEAMLDSISVRKQGSLASIIVSQHLSLIHISQGIVR